MVHWLRTEEFFRFLEAALQTFDLIGLGAILEAVANPALVTPKNHHLWVRDSKWTYRVPSRPLVILVGYLEKFPLVILALGVQSLYRLQGTLSQWVSAPDHIQVPLLQHRDRVVMSTLVELADLRPLVLTTVVDFAPARCVVWVLATNSIYQILCLVFVLSVKVC